MIFRYFRVRGLTGAMEIIPSVHGMVQSKYPIPTISWTTGPSVDVTYAHVPNRKVRRSPMIRRALDNRVPRSYVSKYQSKINANRGPEQSAMNIWNKLRSG